MESDRPWLVQSIRLENFLSFRDSTEVPLGPLNVIIGPNGSGKSNLLEAFDVLRNAPEQLPKPIREGGGVQEWLWKGANGLPVASLDVVVAHPAGEFGLRYRLSFTATGYRFTIVDERIENGQPEAGSPEPCFYYHFDNGRPTLNVKGEKRHLRHEDVNIERSILAQRRDPDQYPEITWLAGILPEMRLYREWSFGRYTAPRLPQRADLPNDMLEPDASNLGLVLNRLRRDPVVKVRLLEALQELYDGIDDYGVHIEGGTVQVFLQEGRFVIPANRLSDGTLRYLCLLAILCHPNPPPLVCIEEPELGLHPDILPALAGLLREASTRCQLIVTTHSEVLVDAMTETPECVLVCEKRGGETSLHRLSKEELAPWLEQYRLGALWMRGEIGGTRW